MSPGLPTSWLVLQCMVLGLVSAGAGARAGAGAGADAGSEAIALIILTKKF
jgi:hypothetical protein